MIGKYNEGQILKEKLEETIQKYTTTRKSPPKVYFEEWNNPMISAIRWVSDIIEIAGGVDIFRDKSKGSLAKDRFVSENDVIEKNPDIIFGCWCGKKVKVDKIKQREGWKNINAVKNNQVYELDPAIFLQPGPAPILDGLRIINEYFDNLE